MIPLKSLLPAALLIVAASCANSHKPVITFTEPTDPVQPTPADSAAWSACGSGLNGSWADADLRYPRGTVPTGMQQSDTLRLTAWRGERVSAQLLLWTADGADGVECGVSDFTGSSSTMPSSIATTRFVRYTLAESTFSVGAATMLSADMLDSLSTLDIEPMTVRPVWLTINVPREAMPGSYTAHVTTASNGNSANITLPLSIEVQDHTLPAPSQWKYHLDLWQHPAAVARAQGIELWSDEHFEAMRPLMGMLADAGQKVITATLNKDPWNHQCHDGYESMIRWTLKNDGTWEYDYSAFDRWVSLMMDLGIDRMINCYSMVPWNCELEYFDQQADSMVTVVAEPGKPMFNRMWKPFLNDFKNHLAQKGWLSITNIAMDERSPEAMDAAAALLNECAPEMGFAIADNHQSYKRYPMMRDVCVSQPKTVVDHSDIVARRAKGFNTTFYMCCNPKYPNTFTFSEPFEAELLGWYGVALDYDGMLRWAYNSWPADPQTDSRYGNWYSGDTYLVYPCARSSVRFERLIDGIENAEKVGILRNEGADMAQLDAMLDSIRNNNINDPSLPWRQITAAAREALYQASRKPGV